MTRRARIGRADVADGVDGDDVGFRRRGCVAILTNRPGRGETPVIGSALTRYMMTFEIGERVRRRGLSGELVEGCVVDALRTAAGPQMVVVLVDREDGRTAAPREVAALARAWSKAAEA